MTNDQFLTVQALLRPLCKLHTTTLTVFNDITTIWIIATLLFTYLSNVRVFIKQTKTAFALATSRLAPFWSDVDRGWRYSVNKFKMTCNYITDIQPKDLKQRGSTLSIANVLIRIAQPRAITMIINFNKTIEISRVIRWLRMNKGAFSREMSASRIEETQTKKKTKKKKKKKCCGNGTTVFRRFIESKRSHFAQDGEGNAALRAFACSSPVTLSCLLKIPLYAFSRAPRASLEGFAPSSSLNRESHTDELLLQFPFTRSSHTAAAISCCTWNRNAWRWRKSNNVSAVRTSRDKFHINLAVIFKSRETCDISFSSKLVKPTYACNLIDRINRNSK